MPPAQVEKEQEQDDVTVHLISNTGYGKSSKELIDLMSQLRALGYFATFYGILSATDTIL